MYQITFAIYVSEQLHISYNYLSIIICYFYNYNSLYYRSYRYRWWPNNHRNQVTIICCSQKMFKKLLWNIQLHIRKSFYIRYQQNHVLPYIFQIHRLPIPFHLYFRVSTCSAEYTIQICIICTSIGICILLQIYPYQMKNTYLTINCHSF